MLKDNNVEAMYKFSREAVEVANHFIDDKHVYDITRFEDFIRLKKKGMLLFFHKQGLFWIVNPQHRFRYCYEAKKEELKQLKQRWKDA
jgi:hypothetical protein